MFKFALARHAVGLLGGGALGYAYHLLLVNNAKYCTNCDQSLTPVAVGAIIGLAITLGSRT